MSSQFQADNTFVRQSQSATEPLESADHGIVDGVLSGLIRQNDLAGVACWKLGFEDSAAWDSIQWN